MRTKGIWTRIASVVVALVVVLTVIFPLSSVVNAEDDISGRLSGVVADPATQVNVVEYLSDIDGPALWSSKDVTASEDGTMSFVISLVAKNMEPEGEGESTPLFMPDSDVQISVYIGRGFKLKSDVSVRIADGELSLPYGETDVNNEKLRCEYNENENIINVIVGSSFVNTVDDGSVMTISYSLAPDTNDISEQADIYYADAAATKIVGVLSAGCNGGNIEKSDDITGSGDYCLVRTVEDNRLVDELFNTGCISVDELVVATYGVSYSYDADYGDAINATLPSDSEEYTSGSEVYPMNPSSVSVDGEKDGVPGTWSFNGWNQDSAVIEDSDVEFVGSWSFEPIPMYGETYTYDKEYPDVVMSTLPISVAEYPNGTDVYPCDPMFTSVEDVVDGMTGKWLFVGWDKEYITINNEPAAFVGSWKWEADAIVVYGVNYAYDGEYPEAVMATIPVSGDTYPVGTEVVPSMPSVTEIAGEKDGVAGVWVFDGWDADSKVIETYDVEFVGTWHFEETEEVLYSESYSYDREYPDVVMSTLPISVAEYPNGVDVYPMDPMFTSVEDVIDGKAGKWTFDGWDKSYVTVNNEPVHFVGSWTWTENPIVVYGVNYSYDGEYPEAVMATIPASGDTYSVGTEVTALNPSSTEVVAEKDGVAGRWLFNGWDANTKVIEDGDVTFIGTWTWVADEVPVVLYKESYRYADGLPELLNNTLPTRKGQYPSGTEVTAANPSVTSVVAQKDGVDGTWTFDGWDANTKVVQDADIEFVGTWTFTAAEVPVATYGVSYRYSGEVSAEVLATLPTRTEKYPANTEIVPDAPTATTVDGTKDGKAGKWKFTGWDATSKVIVDADIEFVGTWTWTEDEVPVVLYKESYRYEGTLPDVVTATLPDRRNEYPTGTEVIPAQPSVTTVKAPKDGKNGTWTFNGWGVVSKIIDNHDIEFVGTWSWKADEIPQEVIVNVNTTWFDYNNGGKTRPASLDVKLCADSIVLKTNTTDSTAGWQTSFTGLPHKRDDVTIKYDIRVPDIQGYKTTITVTGSSPAPASDSTKPTPIVYNYQVTYTLDGGTGLPDTGSMSSLFVSLAGIGILGLGIIFFGLTKRKKNINA